VSASDDPTPEEIERVRAYQRRRDDEESRRRIAERKARIAHYEARFRDAVVGQTIVAVEVDDFDDHGAIRGEREVRFTFADGGMLTLSDPRWNDGSWTVAVD
jgi:hypothetical protein